jgi:signal transduction histidine kinase
LDHSTKRLEQGTVARKTAEQALINSEELSAKLLEESRQLFSGAQEVARAVLSANEEERRALSLRLQDEVGQALLGIHVRLLALESEVTAISESLGRKVELTQGLIRKTVNAIKGILRELTSPP